MAQSSTVEASCKDSRFSESPYNILSRFTSTNISTPTRLLAQISAVGLVTASAGLGAIYAWTTGTQHGPLLAGLMVLMAVALEIAKPLSVVAAIDAFRKWSLTRAVPLALLAVVAIAYSLTSELTLMAGARGDVVAERQAAIKATSSAELEATRARERYEAAKGELASLPTARPVSQLQAEIEGLLLTPGANSCTKIDGKVTASVCPRVAELKAEKGRAERRSALEAIIALPLATENQGRSAAREVKAADPGATALHTYLAALGITIKVDVLTEWLALVPVLALEFGSAFAGVLVQALSGTTVVRATEKRKSEPANAAASNPGPEVVHPPETGVPEDVVHMRERVKERIVDQLKKVGGSTSSSERGLAKLIGASRPTVRRAVNGLVMAGILASEASRNGTILRLVS